jgi:hypothetical protein
MMNFCNIVKLMEDVELYKNIDHHALYQIRKRCTQFGFPEKR